LYFLTDVIATDLYVCKTGEGINAKVMTELKAVSEDFVLFVITAAVYDGLITRFYYAKLARFLTSGDAKR